MQKTRCSNCDTTQGPFETRLTGRKLCKKDIEGCVKRRQTVDFERYDKQTLKTTA